MDANAFCIYTACMAKINKVSRQTTHFTVKITVDDPECLFSIKSFMSYNKVFKATNENSAIKAAANYCNRYNKAYPGVTFKYYTSEVKEYSYYNNLHMKKDEDNAVNINKY